MPLCFLSYLLIVILIEHLASGPHTLTNEDVRRNSQKAVDDWQNSGRCQEIKNNV